MWPELINLLPKEYTRGLRREYAMRLATIALIALVLVVIVNGIFLIPSYLYEQQEISIQNAALQHITSNGATSEEGQVTQQLSTLSQQASTLALLSTAPTASASVRAILAVSRPGITITNFVYTAPTKSAPGTMQITGSADTREDLRGYNASLAALPFISNANLPIEDYAQASNLQFTITLTGSFDPQKETP